MNYEHLIGRAYPENADDNVVEIVAEDIVDISSDDDFNPVPYKWEEDEWYGTSSGTSNDHNMGAVKKEEIDDAHDFKSALSINGSNNAGANSRKKKQYPINKSSEKNQLEDNSDYEPEYDENSGSSDEENNFSYNTKKVAHANSNKTNQQEDLKLSEEEVRLLRRARSYICSICNIIVKTKKEKEKHRKSHNCRYVSFKTTFECPECSYIVNGNSFCFKAHYQKHAGKKMFADVLKECPHCPYKSISANNLTRHLLFHKRKGKFQCEYCTLSADYQKDLTNHLKLHNKFPTGVYSCKECPYSTIHSSSFYHHMKVYHTPENEKKWVYCPHCPLKILWRYMGNLRRHMKRHERTNGIKCPKCTYTSPQIHSINRHLKVHYGKGENVPKYNPPKMEKPLMTCPHCPYKTRALSHFKTHVLRVHDDERMQCADCPFTCKDKYDMVNHVKRHRENNIYKCPWCSFTHFSNACLTKHKLLHTDDKKTHLKYHSKKNKEASKCPICNEIFQAPVYVRRHMSKHQTVDEFEQAVYCANCPYKSKNKGISFINHVQAHLKTDGIKCDYCTYRHNHRSSLSHHLRLHPEFII